jgi:cytochrome c biogenesis protein CcmG/thiol:disulfide interchange protein DsbE
MPNRRAAAGTAAGIATAWIIATAAGASAQSVAPAPALVQAPAATPPPAKPDVVRIVRMKLSAADLASAEAWTEDYRREHGADTAWLDARAWLARGAWMLHESDKALAFAREVRAAVGEPKPETLIAFGAALEVEGRVRTEREGSAAGARFFKEAAQLSPELSFRSRMWKNVNRIELVGQAAPDLAATDFVGAKPPSLAVLRGRPVLLYFWADGCGDCKASAPTLARVHETFGPRGLAMIAPTRLYGPGRDGKPATPAEEKAGIAAALATTYAGLPGLPAPIDAETMVRYGASATPTFALVDRDGIVRLYEPTRLTYDALAAAIQPLLAPATGAPMSAGQEKS